MPNAKKGHKNAARPTPVQIKNFGQKGNDTMIKSLLSEDGFKDGEISYELKKPESAKSNFSQYLQEIVEDEDKDKLPDIE